MKIKMTSIPVNDPIKAFKHYTEVLGFQELMYNEASKLAIVVSPDAPEGAALQLESNELPEYAAFQAALYAKGIPAITYAVEDLKTEYIRLVNLDVHFSQSPTEQSWGWEAIFDDGQGNYIQLIQE